MSELEPKIIYQNKEYLVVQKEAGQLSMSTDDDPENSIHAQITKQRKRPIHVLTRLDRPVSGLMIMSKSRYFQDHYLKLQQAGRVYKSYICIVEGKWTSESGQLKHFHFHDRKFKKARIEDNFLKKEKEVVLDYEIIKTLDKYTVLNVEITSGKFHQIRAQLSKEGFPVKGDVKYGARRGNKDRSIHMHAYKIRFNTRAGDYVEHTSKLPQSDNLWKLAYESLASKKE